MSIHYVWIFIRSSVSNNHISELRAPCPISSLIITRRFFDPFIVDPFNRLSITSYFVCATSFLSLVCFYINIRSSVLIVIPVNIISYDITIVAKLYVGYNSATKYRDSRSRFFHLGNVFSSNFHFSFCLENNFYPTFDILYG